MTGCKYLFSVLLTIYASWRLANARYLLAGLLELVLIFLITNRAAKKKAGYFLNSLCMLLYNVQMAVLAFGNTYVTMVMLTNLSSIEDLSGKKYLYITAVILVLVFSFFPVFHIQMPKKTQYKALGVCAVLEVLCFLILGNGFSPFYGYINLGIQKYENIQLQKEIAAAKAESEKLAKEVSAEIAEVEDAKEAERQRMIEFLKQSTFYQDGIQDYVEKDDALVEQPNVILIFTEGLSQNVVSDERGLMENVRKYQEKSLSFTNYYNHTFATYRGLIGQLYSGYQLENCDVNPMASLQSILALEGYQTGFINTEPHNQEFTDYLNSLGFEQMYGDEESECEGGANSISDKDAYEMLFDTAEELGEQEEPFFLSIYTFGTHATLDSTDEKYEDGSNAELNKFYDVDCQFGAFMKKFEKSDLAEDTIIIFTADHATYQDDSFSSSFTNCRRAVTSMDEIPFFIYYKGIEPKEIDANGRNTICMAPTVLDYLDISEANCFIGTSLFAEQASSVCETSYTDSSVTYSSEDGVIRSLYSEELAEFDEIVKRYYIEKEVMAN